MKYLNLALLLAGVIVAHVPAHAHSGGSSSGDKSAAEVPVSGQPTSIAADSNGRNKPAPRPERAPEFSGPINGVHVNKVHMITWNESCDDTCDSEDDLKVFSVVDPEAKGLNPVSVYFAVLIDNKWRVFKLGQGYAGFPFNVIEHTKAEGRFRLWITKEAVDGSHIFHQQLPYDVDISKAKKGVVEMVRIH